MTVVDPKPSTGTARDALAQTQFRRVYVATFLSNLGRWMQNVVLGLFAWQLAGDPRFIGIVIGFQMLPMLIFGLVGGSLADSLDRRKLLLSTQCWQAAVTLWLAYEVADGDITKTRLVFIVGLLGLGQAMFAPAFNAVLPSLVGRENLSAAISLNSLQQNISRVIGPAIGTYLAARWSVSDVFAINGLTYLFIIIALAMATIPPMEPSKISHWDRLFGGLKLARSKRQIGLPLLMMASFALLCLPFIGQLPNLAEVNLGMDLGVRGEPGPDTVRYGYLYAAFGFGAVTGALSSGTVLLKRSKARIIRIALASFSIVLVIFSLLRNDNWAFPVIYLVGVFYLIFTTSLSTYLQERIADEIRGRVMALWTLAFGGMVGVANFIAGDLVARTSITLVAIGGAAVAMTMALAAVLDDDAPIVGEADI